MQCSGRAESEKYVPDLKWHIAIINWLLPGPRLDIHNIILFYYLPFQARLCRHLQATFLFYSMVSQVVLSVYQIFLHFFSISKKTQYLHSPNNAIYHGNWKTYKYFLSFWVSFKDIKRHLEIAIKKDFFEDSFKK